MHVDSFLPTWKVWIFKETPLALGPLHYVYGSHRNTEGKLRWLFNRSRRFAAEFQVEEMVNPNVTDKRMPFVAPYFDQTFGFDPAIRFEGFAPSAKQSHEVEEMMRAFRFPPPTPVVCGPGLTLVLADTSGLHFRGWAPVGRVRTSSLLHSMPMGDRWIPRKNPFYCQHHHGAC